MRLHDLKPDGERFRAEILAGLCTIPKELPSKYFYDEKGSRLFERICSLEEYYIPSVEESIMRAHIAEMVALVGPQALVIEYGCGDCRKVRLLLDYLPDPMAYVPIDISREQLLQVTADLSATYETVEVIPVCADYTSALTLPVPRRRYQRVAVYFPGSTIGNLSPVSARRFLRHIAGVCGPGGVLLIGVDLKKDLDVLHRAYNDSEGVTAAFNLNLLYRINRELGADFQVDSFEHRAVYNQEEGRIEMHLVSRRLQSVHLDDMTIDIGEGESIWTESSYKYHLAEFAGMAVAAGFRVERVWTDERQWFSVQLLVAK